ncbi:MAG: membrane dipeptidase [Candidatus Odinarchaeota archaeon]|nr:membrane dipeptidase [Candidatus Odinarchaeota archaeon]
MGVKIADLHHDLSHRLRLPSFLGSYKKLPEQDLMKLYSSNFYTVLVAVFTPKPCDPLFHEVELLDPFREAITQIIYYDHLVQRNKDFLKKVLTFDDYLDAKNNNKAGFLYHIEGIYGIETLSDFEALYNLGMRSFSLTWNLGNSFGSGCKDKKDIGLTSRGEEIINFALEHSILIDLAHLSTKTALDVLEIADRNVFISHTGLRPLTNISRNADEKVIEGVVDRKGVIGIIFHKGMLKVNDCKPLDCFLKHMDYIIENYGIDHVAIGSDLYGIMPEDSIYFKSGEVDDVGAVISLLSERYSKTEIEKIAYLNFENFLKRSLGK